MPDSGDVVIRHKLTVEAYYRMAEVGVLEREARVELIEGEIVDRAPIGLDHAGTVDELTLKLVRAYGDDAKVSVQNPVSIDEFSEPQPDLYLARLPAAQYRVRRAGPADVLLLIEVADSSLRYDRTVKLPLYARAGIVEVWIVDLQRRVVEAHRRPEGGVYTEMSTYREADTVAPEALPGAGISLQGVFG